MMQQPRTASTASPLTTAAQDSVQQAGAPRIRAGSVVRPDTVRVADVFTYTVTVELPRDARIEWPSISDTTAAVSQRATVSVNDDATALALLYWLFRRRRTTQVATARAPMDYYARAMHDFERLERLALVDSGERGRFVALAVEVLRTYLTARVPVATLSQTSSELVTAVRDDTRVPVTRLAPLLGETDAIKFARFPIDLARARQLAAEARGIVDDIERAEQARLAVIAEQQAQAQKLETAAKRRDEDAARKKSRRGAA